MTNTAKNIHEKQIHSQRTLEKMFSSNDTADFWMSKDIALYSGEDFPRSKESPPTGKISSENCFQSIDTISSLMSLTKPSAHRSVSHTYIAKLLASKDATYASIDLLPLKSLDSVNMGEACNDDKAEVVSGDYLSQEWLKSQEWYNGADWDQKEVKYTTEMFRTSEALPPPKEARAVEGPGTVSGSCKWEAKYMQGLEQLFYSEPKVAVEDVEMPPLVANPKLAEKKPGHIGPSPSAKEGGKVFVEPNEDDILCERGGKGNLWPGNQRYRQVVDDTKPTYNASQKYEKTLLSQRIVDQMKTEGRRFLKLDKAVGQYYEVPNLVSRKKTGQALREENTPEARLAKRRRYKKY